MKIKDINKDSRYFQTPNLPLIVWFVSMLLAKITDGQLQSVFSVVSFGVLFTWSWLEVFYGTNIIRRILGGVIMVLIIFNRVSS
ncbi:MAG: hypothetical protein AAB914_00525 [Patescibacteria group bacterium]